MQDIRSSDETRPGMFKDQAVVLIKIVKTAIEVISIDRKAYSIAIIQRWTRTERSDFERWITRLDWKMSRYR